MNTEDTIKMIVVSTIKCFRGRGPEYVKVKIDQGTIRINVKGILTNLGKILLDHGEEELVKLIRDRACHIFYQMIIEDIYEKTGLVCSVQYEESDFSQDIRLLVLTIKEEAN